VTVRTLENWKRAAGEEPRREGRPPLEPARWKASLWKVVRAWKRQGRRSGWRTVHAALAGEVSKYEVQVLLRSLKARRRRLERRRIEASRVSAHVECKDAVWSVDGTHLGRAEGAAVEGMAVRDVATQKTLAVLAGASASGADVVRLLEAVAAERGTLPLAVATDNGGPNASAELAEYLQARGIVHLRSVPRTPQHNAWVERGHGELKEDGDLGRGVRLEGAADAATRLARSMRRANGVRLRRSLGYRTADVVDAALPSWYGRACRGRFYKAACAARNKAVLGHGSPRARRIAEREATFRTMEDFGLVSRTRGGIPLPLSNPKCFPTHHTPSRHLSMLARSSTSA
jgi:transposase InsO family protein